MSIFLTLFVKILPLYLIILAGYLAERYYQVDRESIAKVAIYIVAPSVVYIGISEIELSWGSLLLPFISFGLTTGFCLINYYLASKIWGADGTKAIAAFSSATGNTGYFGIPLCLALLGDLSLGPVALIVLGMIFFENTVGYYIFARSNYSVQEAFYKLLKLPSLWAFVIALVVNSLNTNEPEFITNSLNILKSAYTTLGMMIVGLGLAKIKLHHFDWKYLSLVFFNKFLILPTATLLIIFIDKTYFQLMNELIYQVMIIESLVPVAANTVSYASIFNSHPEKAALGVFSSTIFALIYLPLVLSLLL